MDYGRTRMWRNHCFKMQNGRCYYCDGFMVLTLNPSSANAGRRGDTATIEHLNPVRNGGEFWRFDNMVGCCYWCNNMKGAIENNLLINIHPPLFTEFIRWHGKTNKRNQEDIFTSQFVNYMLSRPETHNMIDMDYNHNSDSFNIFRRNLNKEFGDPSLPKVYLSYRLHL
jgi:hypothetical protein